VSTRREMIENIAASCFAVFVFAYTGARKVFGQSQDSSSNATSVRRMIPATRKPVIPKEVIAEFQMKTSDYYGPWVLGEDGKAYNLDDVLHALFQLIKPHWESKDTKK
jgi:hypothetical protein